MGRPKKYLTEEERAEALRVQKREYFRRNAPRLNAARRGRTRDTIAKANELEIPGTNVQYNHRPSAYSSTSKLAAQDDIPRAEISALVNVGAPPEPPQVRLRVRPERYCNRVLGSDGPELREHWRNRYKDKPLDFWLKNCRQGLRRKLSLLQELQGGLPSVISVRHYLSIWDSAVDDVTGSDFAAWGANIFELLSRDSSQEDAAETMRACKRLEVHLHGLVEVIDDLAVLARQVDPRELTEVVGNVDLLKKKACILEDTLKQMITIRSADKLGADSLRLEELVDGLLYQTVDFCTL